MEDRRRRRLVTGLMLIVLGLGLYLLQLTDGPREILFFAIGGAFLAWYFYTRSFGLLIPGCILTGIGVGRVLPSFNGNLDFGGYSPMGLGIGFIAIYVIALVYERKSHWWALIPGGALILSALNAFDSVRNHVTTGWPLIIVFIGLMILLGALKPRPKPRE